MTAHYTGEALSEKVEEAYELQKQQYGKTDNRYNWDGARAHSVTLVARNVITEQEAFEGKGLVISVLNDFLQYLETNYPEEIDANGKA